MPVTDPRLRRGWRRCSTSTSPTTCSPGSSALTAPWTKVPTTAGISTHRALAGAGCRPGPRPLIPTCVKDAPTYERELKFTPGPSFRMPAFDHDELVADPARRHQAAARPTSTPPTCGWPGPAPASASATDEGWTVKLPVSSDVALVRPRSTSAAIRASRPTPPSTSCRRCCATRRSSWPRGSTPRATESCCAIATASSSRSWSTTRCRCSTAPGSAARFRELEVEFSDAAPVDLVERVADRLRAAGAGEPEQIPKIVRALGPRALDPPDLVAPPKLDFASTPRDVLRAAVGDLDQAPAHQRPGCADGRATPKRCTRPASPPGGSVPTCDLPPGHRPGVGRPHCARS